MFGNNAPLACMASNLQYTGPTDNGCFCAILYVQPERFAERGSERNVILYAMT